MSEQNVIHQHITETGEKVTVMLQFKHCLDCMYFKGCYGDGTHRAYFIDPSCLEGPVKKQNL